MNEKEKPAGELSDFDERMAAQDPLYLSRSAAVTALNKHIDAWLADYEFDDGENFTHSPNELESLLIADAFCGLTEDEDYLRLHSAWRALCITGSMPADAAPAGDALALLQTAEGVHVNMMAGKIAKISMAQCAHTHGAPVGDVVMPVIGSYEKPLVRQADALAANFATLLTDISRLPDDNDDPMRYSKRVARQAAIKVLEDALATASRLIELPGLIEKDFKDATEKEKS